MADLGTYAKFETSEGNFKVRLLDKEAPNTVANFTGLAEGTKEWKDPATGERRKAPFYNGIIFHRVINGFMIQGGDPLGQGTGGPGFNFAQLRASHEEDHVHRSHSASQFVWRDELPDRLTEDRAHRISRAGRCQHHKRKPKHL